MIIRFGRKIKPDGSEAPAGFTLVEVMIVTAIVGVLAAVVLPDFSKIIGAYTLNYAAGEMATNICLLQENALRYESTGYRMLFDKIDNCYSYTEDHRTGVYKIVRMPPGIELSYDNFSRPGSAGLAFAANGNPVYRFGGHIALRCRTTGEFRYVIIDSIGRVRIDDVPPA